jgi:hypothetical protein
MERREKNKCKRQTLNRMKNLLKITAVVFTVFIANTVGAQKILVGAGGGYATFSMTDTRDYNKWVQNNLPFTPVLTDDFPDWYFFNGEVLWSFSKFLAAGIKLSTTSTGSRLHLADYSGEYIFDNTQTGWFPGVKLLLGKAPGHNSGLCASVEGGLAFSSMFLREELVVGEEVMRDKETLNALGFYVQPGLNYMQHVGKHIIVSANVSYYLGFENGYYAEGDKDMKITNPDTGENIKPGWNGLRAGIIVYWGFYR